MGMRVRLGPVSLSSSGRVGVRAGPVSVYGGGRRRRSSGGGGATFIGALFLIAVVVWLVKEAVRYWYVSVPAVVLIGWLVYVAVKAGERRAAERHRLAVETERRRYEAWLASPPPPLPLPGRFTQNWIEENAPYLHPGQVPVFLDELRSRGWTEDKISRRVEPHLP